jgi:hypothetical protein
MQHRYAGDIGDFAKYGLLRAIGAGYRLGVAWYLYPDESHNADGKYTAYLDHPKKWRHLDPELFDGLGIIVSESQRDLEVIETSGLLGDAVYANEPLAFEGDALKRGSERASWFQEVLSSLKNCNIVFADPDNGLCEDRKYKISRQSYWKRMPLSEAQNLGAGRTAVIYHHNSRFRGGHAAEIQHWLNLLGSDAIALYWRSVSNRTFFILNPAYEIKQRIKDLVNIWAPYFEVHNRE